MQFEIFGTPHTFDVYFKLRLMFRDKRANVHIDGVSVFALLRVYIVFAKQLHYIIILLLVRELQMVLKTKKQFIYHSYTQGLVTQRYNLKKTIHI